jgi:hypothetical protein
MTESEEQDIIDLFSVLNYDISAGKGKLRNPSAVLDRLERLQSSYTDVKVYEFQYSLVKLSSGTIAIGEIDLEVSTHSNECIDILIEQLHLEIQLIATVTNTLVENINSFSEHECGIMSALIERQHQSRDMLANVLEGVV